MTFGSGCFAMAHIYKWTWRLYDQPGPAGRVSENQFSDLFCPKHFKHLVLKKSRIRETKNLSTDADSRTNTNFKRLRDFSIIKKKIGRLTCSRVHAMARRMGDGRSAPTSRFQCSTRWRWTLCTHPSFLGLHAWATDHWCLVGQQTTGVQLNSKIFSSVG